MIYSILEVLESLGFQDSAFSNGLNKQVDQVAIGVVGSMRECFHAMACLF